MASGGSSRTYALTVDRDANKSLKSVQEFNELDPASIDSWSIKARAHLSDAALLDVVDKPNDLDLRSWLIEAGRVIRDSADETQAIRATDPSPVA